MTTLGQKNVSDSRLEATIASGQSVSGSIRIPPDGPRGLAVLVPAVWTAADIGFQVSIDGETFYPLYDKTGVRVKISGIATGAAQLYAAPAEAWAVGVWEFLRLASLNTSTGAAANQAAARALTVTLLS